MGYLMFCLQAGLVILVSEFTQARRSNIARVYWQGTITLLPEITLAGLGLNWVGLFKARLS